jgi:citrate synthase
MESQIKETEKLTVSGLDDICFAETKLSQVDGESGQLLIGGYPVEELSESASFEAICLLLLRGSLPNRTDLAEFTTSLGKCRAAFFPMMLQSAENYSNGMDFLRASLAQIELQSDSANGTEILIAAAAVAAAAWSRLRVGRQPIAPDPTLSHTEDYLRMSLGQQPNHHMIAALNTYLVTVADHGMNASTFAARVIASTGSDLASAVVGAIGALKGPLHGGAPGPVLDMLDAIGAPENAAMWLDAELQQGRRIMGMGHRIYRTRDPRAAVLERALQNLEASGHKSPRLSLARSVEKAASSILAERYPNRPLHANVEFYTAVLLDAIGLPREQFSPTFAVGRIAGWCAHVAEQKKFGRLVRPQSTYVGPMRHQR